MNALPPPPFGADHDPDSAETAAVQARLRAAVTNRAASLPPIDEAAGLAAIQARVARRSPAAALPTRRGMLAVLGAAAVLAAVALVVRNDRHDTVRTITPASTTAPPSSTTTTPVTTPPSGTHTPAEPGIWPAPSMNIRYPDAPSAALGFAKGFLGQPNAVVDTAASTAPGVVAVRPNPGPGPITLVRTAQHDDGFVVVDASTEQIQLESLATGDTLTEVLDVSGRSVAFEATLSVQLWPADLTAAPLVDKITMGGGTELMPFHTTVNVPSTASGPLVLLLAEVDASGRSTFSYATVVRLDPPTPIVAVTGGHLEHLSRDGKFAKPIAGAPAVASVHGGFATLPGDCAGTRSLASLHGGPADPAAVRTALAATTGGTGIVTVACDGAVTGDSHTVGSGQSVAGADIRAVEAGAGTGPAVLELDVGGKRLLRRLDIATAQTLDDSAYLVDGQSATFLDDHTNAYVAGDGLVYSLDVTAATPTSTLLFDPGKPVVSLDANESSLLLFVTSDGGLFAWAPGSGLDLIGEGYTSAAW